MSWKNPDNPVLVNDFMLIESLLKYSIHHIISYLRCFIMQNTYDDF